MAVLGQGLVLMIAGMGIVYFFLVILVCVTNLTVKPLARFSSIFPDEAPKKAPAKKAAGGDDENIALAIAVALNG